MTNTINISHPTQPLTDLDYQMIKQLLIKRGKIEAEDAAYYEVYGGFRNTSNANGPFDAFSAMIAIGPVEKFVHGYFADGRPVLSGIVEVGDHDTMIAALTAAKAMLY